MARATRIVAVVLPRFLTSRRPVPILRARGVRIFGVIFPKQIHYILRLIFIPTQNTGMTGPSVQYFPKYSAAARRRLRARLERIGGPWPTIRPPSGGTTTRPHGARGACRWLPCVPEGLACRSTRRRMWGRVVVSAPFLFSIVSSSLCRSDAAVSPAPAAVAPRPRTRNPRPRPPIPDWSTIRRPIRSASNLRPTPPNPRSRRWRAAWRCRQLRGQRRPRLDRRVDVGVGQIWPELLHQPIAHQGEGAGDLIGGEAIRNLSQGAAAAATATGDAGSGGAMGMPAAVNQKATS